MTSKHPRLTYTLRYRAGLWVLVAPDGGECKVGRAVKSDAVWASAGYLRDCWSILRIRSELRICDRRGKIVDSRTYGEDPKRTKG